MYGQINPYQQQMMNYSTQGQTLQRVNGIDGAKAYQLGANSTVALFDSNSDVFYVKSTDMAGFPTIRVFKFEEIKQDLSEIKQDYVSREEMEAYVKQFIQEQSTIQQPEQVITTKGVSEQLGKSRGDISTNVSK